MMPFPKTRPANSGPWRSPLSEIEKKLEAMREVMRDHKIAALRLRGSDWFSWASGGAQCVVLQTQETGVAEILVTRQEAFFLSDAIEAPRLRAEELQAPYLLWTAPWQDPAAREAFVHDHGRGGLIASDRPRGAEHRLPAALWMLRRQLGSEEIERYRILGRESAEAMRETLNAAEPAWSEWQLAAAGSQALLRRGIQPALILAASHRRFEAYRHPTPTHEKLGERALLVFCARRHGLFANLSRSVYFRAPTAAEHRAKEQLAAIEALAWEGSKEGHSLDAIYHAIAGGYASFGHGEAIDQHHQGGPCGYAAREAIAGPQTHEPLQPPAALAWNPSLPGCKLEDTILIQGHGQLEILTHDPLWPSFTWGAHSRPDFLVRK